MKLSKQQIDHATMRLNQAAEKRIAKQAEALAPKPELPSLSFEQKYELIRTSKALLKPLEKISSYTDLTDAYTYPTHLKAVEAAKKKQSVYDAAYSRIADKVNAERDRVLDQIMLGLAEDAIAAIDTFGARK